MRLRLRGCLYAIIGGVFLKLHFFISLFVCCRHVGCHCTTEEGDRVVENIGCAIIVIIKFVDQDFI